DGGIGRRGASVEVSDRDRGRALSLRCRVRLVLFPPRSVSRPVLRWDLPGPAALSPESLGLSSGPPALGIHLAPAAALELRLLRLRVHEQIVPWGLGAIPRISCCGTGRSSAIRSRPRRSTTPEGSPPRRPEG